MNGKNPYRRCHDLIPMTTGRMLLGVGSSVLFVIVLLESGLIGSFMGLVVMVTFVIVGWARALR